MGLHIILASHTCTQLHLKLHLNCRSCLDFHHSGNFFCYRSGSTKLSLLSWKSAILLVTAALHSTDRYCPWDDPLTSPTLDVWLYVNNLWLYTGYIKTHYFDVTGCGSQNCDSYLPRGKIFCISWYINRNVKPHQFKN